MSYIGHEFLVLVSVYSHVIPEQYILSRHAFSQTPVSREQNHPAEQQD